MMIDAAALEVYCVYREAFVKRPEVRIAVRDAARGLVNVVMTDERRGVTLVHRHDPTYRGWTLALCAERAAEVFV